MISIHNQDSVLLNNRIQPIYGRTRDKNRCCYSTVTLKLYESPFLYMKVENDPETVKLKEMFMLILEWWQILGHLDYWIEINNRPANRLEARVWFMDKSGKSKRLPMTDEEQDVAIRRLDIQCGQAFGKTCRQLLSEARKRMDPKELEGIEI